MIARPLKMLWIFLLLIILLTNWGWGAFFVGCLITIDVELKK